MCCQISGKIQFHILSILKIMHIQYNRKLNYNVHNSNYLLQVQIHNHKVYI